MQELGEVWKAAAAALVILTFLLGYSLDEKK